MLERHGEDSPALLDFCWRKEPQAKGHSMAHPTHGARGTLQGVFLGSLHFNTQLL